MWKAISDLIQRGDADDAALILFLMGIIVIGVIGVICLTIYEVAELFSPFA